MKFTTALKIAALSLAAFISGCDNTGLVFVDYDGTLKSGIEITSFKDTPFVATIEYDYSRISNFSVDRTEVVLERNVIPVNEWKNPSADLSKYTARQIDIQKKLSELVNLNGEYIVDLKPRKASIKSHVPGKVEIYCVDDMGAYRIYYK